MTTGLHTVTDISCVKWYAQSAFFWRILSLKFIRHLCRHSGEVLGWRYVKAYETSQKYKEGKYILEKALTGEFRSRDIPRCPARS